MHRTRALGVLALSFALSACYGEELSANEAAQSEGGQEVKLALTSSALIERCTIRLGSGGRTYEHSVTLDEGEQQAVKGVSASEFIRSTHGPCHFRIYNGADLTGPSVVLGTNLTTRIRAGEDGLTRKDRGGGDTWKVRSVMIYRTSTACTMRAGANGARMEYHVDYASPLPGLNRIDHLTGANCSAQVHKAADFGAKDSNNRFKRLHASSMSRAAYDPGFAVRSLALWSDKSECLSVAKDKGRCLPQTLLTENIYTATADGDRDQDGLDDWLEDELADAFTPAYFNHSTENATRTSVYINADGAPMLEPATIFQVSPYDSSTIRIQYMRLWLNDIWGSPTCPGHAGDSQRHTLYLRTLDASSAQRGQFWYVIKVGGGIQDELRWELGDDSLRSAHFIRLSDESGPARHLAIYFSKGKHHEYADSGWSGAPDKECVADLAYVNGRGHQHTPSYPMRLASLRSPQGQGDAFDFTNVGNIAHPFFDDLASYGFASECVWGCGDFYRANSPSRGFD